MERILQSSVAANLPVKELTGELRAFMAPVAARLPDKRLEEVVRLGVQGIIGAQSPVVTKMARALVRDEQTVWPMAKRFYRFVRNPRFSHRDLLKGLYGIAQRVVAEQDASQLVVALDPVNFEKPYTQKLEGVSTVM